LERRTPGAQTTDQQLPIINCESPITSHQFVNNHEHAQRSGCLAAWRRFGEGGLSGDIQFLYMALGSASELDTQLEISKEIGIGELAELAALQDMLGRVSNGVT
jgi:hypothetical protein